MPRRFLIIVFLLVPTFAFAGNRITGDYAGCISRDDLHQFIKAIADKDYRSMNLMLRNECAPVKGREYSMLERGDTESEIRVYAPNGGSVDLFVPSSAVQ